MSTTIDLNILEQPILENEAYFAYMLPDTDIPFLNANLKGSFLHNSFIGLFKETQRSYSRSLVLVKVTANPITPSFTPDVESGYDKLATHVTNHGSTTPKTGYNSLYLNNIGIKYDYSTKQFCTTTPLQQITNFTYNYYIIGFTDTISMNDVNAHSVNNPVKTKYGANSFETIADRLITCINYYSSNTSGLSTYLNAKAYKPHNLLDCSYCDGTNRLWASPRKPTPGMIKIKPEHVAGLYKYVTGLYTGIIAYNPTRIDNPDKAELLLNNLVMGNATSGDDRLFVSNLDFSEPLYDEKKHLAYNYSIHEDGTVDYTITFDSINSLGYQNIKDFEITDVIGTRIHATAHITNIPQKQYWYEKQLSYNTIITSQKLKNIFDACGLSDFFKICTDIDISDSKNIKFTNTVYIKTGYIAKLLHTIPETGHIYVTNLKVISKLFTPGTPSKIEINNIHHMDANKHVDSNKCKVIFTHSATGTYNPALEGIDITGATPASLNETINTKLATIFPSLAQQIQMTLFSYQKRNIIWMHEHECKINAGTLKVSIPYGKLYTTDGLSYNDVLLHKVIIDSTEYTHFDTNLSKVDSTFYKDADQTQTLDLNLTGGLLCDDVGLGKTLSTICHIVNQKPLDLSRNASWELNNCVLVPSRLLQQWKFEIEKYTAPGVISVITLGSITDIKKLFKKQANGVLKMEKTYDIYIISINLLGNKNYLTYLAANYAAEHALNGLERGYFDIFRTKWNRLICDEAHERVMSTTNWGIGYMSGRENQTMTKANRIITRNIIFNIHANYRWGLTATPLEHATNNILGYLVWFADTIKNKLLDSSVANKLYIENIMESGLTSDGLAVYDKAFFNLPKFITKTNLEKFQELCFTKTTKTAVSGEIKIPIFTEEIREIELSQIERSIYNNARADNSNVRHTGHIDRIKRLFQLCTNINISDVDIENMGIIPADGQHLTLEQLNASMIKQFQKQLKEVASELSREKATGPDAEAKKQVAKKLKEYMELNIDPDLPRNMDGPIGQKIRYFMEACNNSNGSCNGVNASQIDSMVMKNLRKSLYVRLLECKDEPMNLFVLVSELMSSSTTEQKPDWNDAKTMMITYYLINSFYTKASQNSKDTGETISKLEREVTRLQNQIKLFQSNDFIKEKTADPCIICWADYDDTSAIAVTNCRHIFCGGCFHSMGANKASFPCPECRADIICKNTKVTTMAQIKQADKPPEPEPVPVETALTLSPGEDPNWKAGCVSKYGTKMSVLIEYLRTIFAEEGKTNRAIIFSQYDNMLKLIGKTLTEYKISNVYCKGNVHVINKNIDKFKRDTSIRVIMLSSEHSNSGSNLTEASHIILVDVLNMDAAQTKDVECQAIGRAVRLGQQKPVKVVRLITKNTVEEEYYRKNKYNIASIQ